MAKSRALGAFLRGWICWALSFNQLQTHLQQITYQSAVRLREAASSIIKRHNLRHIGTCLSAGIGREGKQMEHWNIWGWRHSWSCGSVVWHIWWWRWLLKRYGTQAEATTSRAKKKYINLTNRALARYFCYTWNGRSIQFVYYVVY